MPSSAWRRALSSIGSAMSSRAVVLAMVTTLSASQNDAAMSQRYYDEIVFDLAKQKWFVNVEQVPVVVGQAAYSYPANVVHLMHVFFGSAQLELARLRELEYVNPQWRDEEGEAVSYVLENEAARQFRLYPIPDVPTSTPLVLFGEPLGRDFRDGAITEMYSETRTTLPNYLDLPIALKIIEREFSRESDHQHSVFAAAAGKIGDLMLKMVDPRLP